MPINLSNLGLRLSLPCSLPQSYVDTLLRQEVIKSPSAQQLTTLEMSHLIGDQIQSRALPVNYAPSTIDAQSLDSQPMERVQGRSTVTWVVWICEECLNPHIHVTTWVDPNNEFRNTGDDPPMDHGWCPDCQDNCQYDCIDIDATSMGHAIQIAEQQAREHSDRRTDQPSDDSHS